MYREMEAEKRSKDLAILAFQLDVLNKMIKTPYVNGAGRFSALCCSHA
jgi:hypothetical protein